MESKKTFGEYICRRRKELGLTQREFADKLYVTESAVSKWERGMSYPDVTLLRDICAVLDVTEHELLTASVDTEKRTADKLAQKYLRLTRNYRLAQYILFGGILLGCAIGNLAGQGGLSWFWIALAAVALAASLSLVPALGDMHPKLEKYKWTLSAGCAVASLEVLLLVCCLYTGGDWFPVACASTLFGLGLVLLPFLLPALPLPGFLTKRKTSFYLGVETALLLILLLVCCLYTGGDWFLMASVGVIFGLSLLFTPIFLRQMPLAGPLVRCKATLYLGVETALLLLLLLTACLYTGGSWFPVAAVSVVFGLGLVFLPVPLGQLPLPEDVGRHKALLYFGIETALLFALLAAAEWYTGGGWLFRYGVPFALVGLALPWGLMGVLRYLPVDVWFRASLSSFWVGLWVWLTPWLVDRIMLLNGWEADQSYALRIPFDFSNWDIHHITYNVIASILLSFGALGVLLAAVGAIRRRR